MGRKRLTDEDVARRAGLMTLPENGAWIAIKGFGACYRGNRIIPAHREIGIRHLDIYWGCKEVLASTLRVNRFRRRRLELWQAVYYDMQRGDNFDDAMDRASNEYSEFISNHPMHSRYQVSLITIMHPCPEEVRFYNGEVIVIDNDVIRGLLAENMVETILFGQDSVMPVLEIAVQEIVDALQIDGLSASDAYHMVLTAGMTDEAHTPNWFYRPIGELAERFVE